MIRVFDFAGTPRAMGEAFGESCRAEIRELYELRLRNAIAQAKEYGGRRVSEQDVVDLAAKCLAIAEGYHADGHAELTGIARAAGLTAAQVYAMNGLTDLRDVLAWYTPEEPPHGCSSFIVLGDRTKDGKPRLGQSWDLATDNMPFVVAVKRRPKDAPATFSLTTVGCLCLIGMNEEGVAMGTTNLRTRDARPGIVYLSIIHKALSSRTHEEAARAVTEARRAGAHYYALLDARGNASAIECAAERAEREDLTAGYHVHCNHVLDEGLAELEGNTPRASSECRQRRMGALIAGAGQGGLDDGALKGFLADHENGENAICRHDYAGVSSNGAVIMSPSAPKMWVAQGWPCKAEWVELVA